MLPAQWINRFIWMKIENKEENESSDLCEWIIFQGQVLSKKNVFLIYINVDWSATLHCILIFSLVQELTSILVKTKKTKQVTGMMVWKGGRAYVLLLSVLSYAACLDWPSTLAVETKGVIGTACFNIHINIDKKTEWTASYIDKWEWDKTCDVYQTSCWPMKKNYWS